VTAKTDDNKDKPMARLLIVDDDSDTILALRIGLADYGFLVDAFTNPDEALQRFKSNAESYCLVLLDKEVRYFTVFLYVYRLSIKHMQSELRRRYRRF
jgi:CheY-like chemotaxis protein